MTAACPDCTAVAAAGQLTHDLTCPLGLGTDATCDADRRFFEDHPGTRVYWRKPTPFEVAELRFAGICPDAPGQVTGRVQVTNVRPGFRTRSLAGVYVADQDSM
jgi:hypothetical protein